MKLEKIISFANKRTRTQFLAMERSLRATGCKLPVWVIPYDDNKFDLPDNCIWWEVKEISNWLTDNKCFNMMRKYQCLLTANYQYVDSDIIFLRNPEEVLHDLTGFITSCVHWKAPQETVLPESRKFHEQVSTTWETDVFNCGQFACDVQLYTIDQLKQIAMDERYKVACIDLKLSDQPGLNLLVLLSKVKVTNVTLPPYKMESTWAGSYPGEYEHYWVDEKKKPYFIHWAGSSNMGYKKPIDQLFYKFLTPEEKQTWETEINKQQAKSNTRYRRMRRKLSILKQILTNIKFDQ